LVAAASLVADAAAVAFRLYDIGHTGAIERSELKRFLVALMVDNPDIDLDEQALDEIVDEVSRGAG
jgi:Ca2+-binding EF-hand superfamily protein